MNTTLTKTEIVDLKALKWAINNYHDLKLNRRVWQTLNIHNYKFVDQLTVLKNVHSQCSSNGALKVTYRQCESKGRYYALGGMGFQSMLRELRGLLARNHYYDLDIVNCDPTLLSQYCQKKLPDLFLPMLNDYVNNRDKYLKELMNDYEIDRDEAKQIILKISRGGTKDFKALEDKEKWLIDLQKEFKKIGQRLIDMLPDLVDEIENKKDNKPNSLWGSLMSVVMQDVENQVIQELDAFLTKKRFKVDSLIFDGVLVRNDKPLTEDMLRKASDHIESATGYKVKFAIKPLDTTLKLPDNLLSIDEEYAELKQDFEKSVCKVMNPLTFVVKSKENQWVYKSKADVRDTYEDLSDWKGVTIVGGKAPKSFIENWLKDPSKLAYDSIDFLPPPIECSSNVFNTYRGLDAEKLDNVEYQQACVDTLRKHTKFLVGDSETNNDYFEKFFANIVQFPAQLSQVAIVLKSREGCGKNLFLEVIEKILGKEYYCTTTSPKDKLFGRFNSGKMNKLLINLDETKSKDAKDYYEIIKAEITNPTTLIERKGHDGFSVRNFARYFFTTNNELPIKISKSDRRFCLFECTGKKKSDKYYKKISSMLTNPSALYSYYKYLMSIDLAGYNFSAERPETEFYKRSVKQCEENIYEFLQSLVMNDIVLNDDDVRLQDTTYLYRASVLYQHYVQFCVDNKYINRLSHNAFGSTVCLMASKSRDKKGYLYKFEKERIESYLKFNNYWEEPEECLIDDD
jgi:hypothetical protein